MKILHIHPAMTCGGIEAMISALANEMAKKEDVTVCSIFKPNKNDLFWNRLSSNVKRITLGKQKRGFSLKIIFKIFKTIRTGRYDIVHIHGMFYYYALSIILLHKKVNFFYTIHSDAKMENTFWDKKLFYIKKYCFQKGFIHPITISKTSQESFSNLYHCNSQLIYNGIAKPILIDENPIKKYRLTENTKVFIHAGRISIPKNQLVLCKVFKRLIDEGHDVVLLIAGARQREDIYKSIEPFFCERIQYIGERNDITQLMAYCDGMCLPSIWEGLPVTLLESLSVGCIPICSNVGGIPNIIDSGKNGFLSLSSSEKDYYSIMKKYLSLSSNELLELKRNCKESFSKYDIINSASLYIKAYKLI